MQKMSSSCTVTISALPLEILELALLCLSIRDIFQCAHVCKAWKEIIAGSSPLQKSLFFVPSGSNTEAQGSQPNPILLEMFPALLKSTGGAGKTVNQFIAETPWAKDDQWAEAIARPEASWRRMYTEQPPIPHIFTYRGFESSKTTRTMEVLFSAAILSLKIDLGSCYEKLCVEHHPDSKTYRLLEGGIGEKLLYPKDYDRVRKACIKTGNWKKVL
jgi:hypothetical protein